MTVQYVHLDHESYKAMETAMREFKETTHTSTGGFYHKSIRFPVGPGLIMGWMYVNIPNRAGYLRPRRGNRRWRSCGTTK